MGGVLSHLLILMLLLTAPLAARASCDSAINQARTQCDNAVKAAGAIDNARSAATAASSGTDINQNCSNIGRDIGQQQGNLANAKAQCEAAAARCKGQCTKPQDVPKQPQCDSAVRSQIAQLTSAMGGLAANGQQAAACQQQSDSGKQPPPMPPPPKGDDKKDEKQAFQCDSEQGARYSDCNQHYVSKCTSSMSSGNCDAFAERYCGSPNAGTSIPMPGTSGTRTQSQTKYVTDKRGEGLGSDFCKMVTAYRYCQTMGREGCPSCRAGGAGADSLSPEMLKKGRETCPTDPAFLDPAVVAKINQTPSTGTSTPDVGINETKNKNPDLTAGTSAPGSGSGGGRLSGGAGGGGATLDGARPESSPIGDSQDFTGGAGGGSGGGYNPSSYASEESTEEDERTPTSSGAAKPLPAGAVEGLAADVSNQNGPSLFSIGTGAYKALCQKGALKNCVQAKN